MTLFHQTQASIDETLDQVLRRWQPDASKQATFREWAVSTLNLIDDLAERDLVLAIDQVEDLRDALHTELAEGLLDRAHIDLERVSRLSWLTWCVDQLRGVPAAQLQVA